MLNVVLAGLASRFSLQAAKFYFRYYVEKGKKEKFIQLGIWPEMKLVTANELAKSMVPVEGKEPQQELEQQRRPNSTSCRSIVLRIV